jgi:prolyl-tRNA synthetase
VPGYASPIGLAPEALVVVDLEAAAAPNLAAGANEAGYHLLNTNAGRDYQPGMVADIASAGEGDACERCGSPLSLTRGIEVGNIFKLGTRYSQAVGAVFLDADGVEHPIVMGSYGIGTGRLLACVAEEHHDDRGLAWPASVAPYDVHLVSLGAAGTPAFEAAQRVAAALEQAGIEPLFDDRAESPGVKFADADLIGAPIRITSSERAQKAGGLEMKLRDREEKVIVPVADVPSRVAGVLSELRLAEERRAETAALSLPPASRSTG